METDEPKIPYKDISGGLIPGPRTLKVLHNLGSMTDEGVGKAEDDSIR